MANQFNYVDWLAAESLRRLTNKLVCTQFANTDYVDDFKKEFAVGDTVRINYPQRFIAGSGLGYQPQGINRRNTTVVVDRVANVHFEYDSIESALKMERGREKLKKEYIDPAMDELAQKLESDFALFAYQNCPNIVGALGTNQSTFDLTSAAALQLLTEMGCPQGEKGMILPPAVTRAVKGGAVTYFNPSSDLSKQYREGSIGRADGFDWYSSVSLYSHTPGVIAGTTCTLASAVADASSSLSCTVGVGDTFKKGDILGLGGSYPVNPQTRRRLQTSTTKTVVVTADVTATTTTATVPIYPTIYGPGNQYQNVDALPANGATITVFPGTTTPATKSGIQGLALHRNAFAMVAVPMEVPKAVELASQMRDPETGISIRFVRAWDQRESKMTNRFDVLYGFGQLYGENCSVRVLCA